MGCGQDLQLLLFSNSFSAQSLFMAMSIQLFVHLKNSSIYFNSDLFYFFPHLFYCLSIIYHVSETLWKAPEYGDKRPNT